MEFSSPKNHPSYPNSNLLRQSTGLQVLARAQQCLTGRDTKDRSGRCGTSSPSSSCAVGGLGEVVGFNKRHTVDGRNPAPVDK